MGKILLLDQVDSTPTVTPTTSVQVLQTDTIGSNPYAYIEAKYLCSIEQTGTSAAQTLTFNITVNGVVSKAYVFKTYAVLKYDIVEFSAAEPAKEGGVVKLELAAAAGADAQTSIIVKRVQIEGNN